MSLAKLIRKLLPPEEKIFYELFEKNAEHALKAALLFQKIVNDKLTEDRWIEAKALKHMSNAVTKETLNKLNATFVTPIDREDIQYLTFVLNKITKRIVRGCVNHRVYRLDIHPEVMLKQADTLVKATQELQNMVNYLKKNNISQEVQDCHHRMIEVESHGDDILYQAMDELFSGKFDPLTVMKLRDIYKTIETATDNCSNAAEAMMNILLKHG